MKGDRLNTMPSPFGGNRRAALKCGVALGLILSLGAFPALAQDNSDTTNVSSENTTNISTTVAKKAAPNDTKNSNTTMSNDDISKSGSSSTSDALKKMPSLGTFNATGTSSGSSASQLFASPQVHGLSGPLTVVLINGHRLQGGGIYGTTANPGIIPSSAIDHVEVEDDGGNPIYGNDAISGVVNFVLKKDYNGVQVSGRHGFGRGVQNWNFNMLAGTSWDTGSVLVAYEHSSSTDLVASKRSYVTADQSKYYGSSYDLRSTICSPANVTLGNSTYGLTASGLATSATNRCEQDKNTDLMPETSHDQGLISLHQYLNPSVELHADVMFDYETMDSKISSTSDILSTGGTSVSVTSSSPFYQSINGSAADESVTYDPARDTGTLHNKGIMQGINSTFGTQIDLGHDWYNLTDVTYGLEDLTYRGAGINQTYVEDAAEDGTLNPYGIGDYNTKDVVHAILDYGNAYTARQSMAQMVSRFSGPLYQLPGGTVHLSVGSELRVDMYEATAKTGALYADDLLSEEAAELTSVATAMNRTSYAFYGDIVIPIVGEANRLPLVYSLTMEAAVRYDHYNDVGGSANPHYKISWDPIRGLELYSSYAMSFHDPMMTDGGKAIDTQALKYQDMTGSADPDAYSVVLQGGSDGLKPETARNISFGFTVLPDLIPGFTGGMNYFNIRYRNMVSTVGDTLYTDSSTVYDAFRIYNPTLEEAETWIGSMRHNGTFDLTEKLPTAIYNERRMNLATEDIEGLDFSARYNQETGIGQLGAGLSGTLMLKYNRKFNATGETYKYVGTSTMVDLKMRYNIDWSKGPYNASLFINFTNSYKNTNVTTNQHVDAFVTLDTHFGWDLPFKGQLSNVTLSLDVQNILDKDPPHYYATSTEAVETGYDPANASALGRMVSVSIAKKW